MAPAQPATALTKAEPSYKDLPKSRQQRRFEQRQAAKPVKKK